MSWKNSKKDLPKEGDWVAVLIEPHKGRVTSTQVLFGVVEMHDCGCVTVDNDDELGLGCVQYMLYEKDDCNYMHDREHAVAWMLASDFPMPNWIRY